MAEPGVVALGIDVGGSKVAMGIVAADGSILARDRVVNREHRRKDLLGEVARRAALLAAAAPAGTVLAGVGVGICELVDPGGQVVSSVSIPWSRAELDEALSGPGPVSIDADVRAAARAEGRFGAGRPHASFGYVTVGTGISSCLVLDGEPWVGAHGAAQLLGSGSLALPCPHCGRGLECSLEDVGSGAAIASRYRNRSGSAAAGADVVLAAASSGDAIAGEVVGEATDALGGFLAMFVNITDPEALIVGGGLGSAPGPFRDRVFAAVRRHVWAPAARSLPIHPAELGPEAGVVGAGWQVLREGTRKGTLASRGRARAGAASTAASRT